MNSLILISPDQGSGFKPILSGNGSQFLDDKGLDDRRAPRDCAVL